MAIGDSKTCVDTYAKVTGEAKYVADLEPKHAYVAKVVRSTIANGVVTGFDLKAARAVPGVVAIYTCFAARYVNPSDGQRRAEHAQNGWVLCQWKTGSNCIG